MFQKILLFSIILKFSEAIICHKLNMDKNEYYYSNLKESLLINTDQADYTKIDHIEFDFLRFEQSLHYEIQGKQISAILLESFQNYDELQICILIMNENTYFIQCINGFTFIQDQTNLEYSNKTEIITQPNEVCESIFYDKQSQFTLFCYSQNNFKLISINLDQEIQYYQFYNYPQDRQLQFCKSISIQIKPFHYLIAYINCLDWSVFEVFDNNITLIIDQFSLRAYQDKIDLTNLVNLQTCYFNHLEKYLVYALFDTGYIKIENQQISKFIPLNQEKRIQITQLIFDSHCEVNIFLGQEESLRPFQIYQQYSTISFSKSIQFPKVYQHEQFIIFQHEKTLQIFINQKLNQYYDIQGLLLFYRTFNYLFAIDTSINQIKIFKMKHLSRYIVPQYEYIYEYYLHNFNYFEQEPARCTKILLKDSQTHLSEQKFVKMVYNVFKNKLELNFFINYNELMMGIPIYLEVPIQYQNILSIDQNKNNFSDICQFHRIFQNSVFLLYDFYASLYIFQDEKYIYFYNCTQQKLSHQQQIQGKDVFIIANKIVIIDKILNLINIIIVSQYQLNYHNLKIDYEIIQLSLFLNFVYINFKEKEPLIIEIFGNDLILYNNGIKNKEIVLFYYKDFNFFQIYQFKDYLFIQQNTDIFKIKFLDQKILTMNQILVFIVLHNIEQTLKVYTFEKNEIIFLQNIDLFDYQVYNPLSYLYYNSDFYIVTEKCNKLYLLIYSPKLLQYKIKRIIQIGQPNFYIRGEIIYYYDENNFLVYTNNQQMVVSYHIQGFNKLFEIVNLHLNIFSLLDLKQYNIYHLNFKILIQNFKIFPKSNLSITLNSNIKNKIQLFNHFSGPINKLSLNEKCNFNLSGPLQIRQRIDSCNQSTFIICLQKQNFEGSIIRKSQYLYMKILQESNQTNKIKVVLLSNTHNLFQLRNGDLLQIINFNELTCQAIIYKYDFILDKYIQFKQFNISYIFNQATQIRIISNILYLQTDSKFYLLYINENFINQIYESNFHFDIAQIQNSDEEYLVVNSINDIVIDHYNISSGIVSQIQTYNIKKMNLLKLAFDEREFYQNPTLIENMEFILIDALKTEISIQINCIFNYENILFYVTITLNQLNQSFEQNILKILRNMQEKEKIIYTDKNFAIFGNYPYYTIFDLRQEQQFYDSIVQMKNDFRMVIQDYNNTHYILFNPQIQEAYLIEIGYEINILNKEKTSECVLIAENNISKAEIQVFYQYEEFNNNLDQKNIIIISIIIICIFIVIIIFIIRRQKLKKHNQKLFQSISQLDQSKLQ